LLILLLVLVQVLTNTSYAQAAQGVAAAMQRYAAQRHPYQRAADEVELAVLTAQLQAARTAARAAAGQGRVHRAAAAAAAAAEQSQPREHEEL
jgi:hypothetical protein